MMPAGRPEFTVDEINRLIAEGGARLSPTIAARFEIDRAAERRRHHLFYGAIALLLYDIFLLYDLLLVPDVFMEAAILRLGVATPLGIAVLWGLYAFRSAVFRETSLAAICVACFGIIVHISASSTDPLAAYHHFGAALVVIFANVVQRVEFRYAVGAAIVCIILYAVEVPHIDWLPDRAGYAATMMMGGTVLLTLFANHRMESQLRLAYLFHLRDEIRNEELSTLARIDPLTGLGNRRQLERHMSELWTRRDGERKPAAVLVCDIDHFKAYYDHYGHPAGDLCLKRVAATVSDSVRDIEGLAFRFGGEEFVVVLDGVDLMDGVRVGQRIRRAVEELAIPHAADGRARVVTISIGVSASVPAGAISQAETITAADAALYAAKRAGRNQVWPPLGRTGGAVEYLSEVRDRAG
jgi:diguanylate cyclase (GGDEF)-like protein